ncbi:CBS domain-containing protein [uncultured Sneathiella sp.]|jgi:CBS domain-containing protein|uniref:CBS domain-containing protein n=1 Tax=uncultured Sneathiella sp. TaxID=879315 RepID=UPI0030D735BB|tara:strand:- start:1727 stop:2425 length:699 start_codon:yes stop_codon:yes gene_type:complete
MQVKDIMTTTVATVQPDTGIQEIAKLLLERRISAAPVVDANGQILGIVSEGDLMRRSETGTDRHPSWWLSLVASPEERAINYIKSHGGHARDIMTSDLISVNEDASLEEVAKTLEKHRIKRLPVLRNGKLIGIVSRADLLRGLIAFRAGRSSSTDDEAIRAAVEAELSEADIRREFVSVVVSGGIVHLWGAVESDAEKRAASIAAERVSGVTDVQDEIGILPPSVRSTLWAE